MLVYLLLITLAIQNAMGSPFNFPDESNSGNNRNGEMILPGIYFHSDARSGKSFDIKEDPQAAISFGSSELVKLPSLTSIMFSSSRVVLPKQDDPKPVHAISFGENSANVAIGFNDGTADKIDDKVNVPMLFFDEPNPAENVEKENNKTHHSVPIPSSFDVPRLDNIKKMENETGHTLKQDFSVFIVIDDSLVKAVFHFSNSTTADSVEENNSNIQTSSQSPEVVFFNPRDDEVSVSNSFLFPTPRSPGVTEDIPPIKITCESEEFMPYNDTCYQLLTSGPCEKGSWLISKDGLSAKCEQRPCAVNEVLFNNACVDIETPKICPEGQLLKNNQSGIGSCQCPNGGIFHQGECHCTNGEMFFQGECHKFLSSGPCGKENWLLLRDLKNAECAPRLCPLGEIFYDDMCVDPQNTTVCASGQNLYVDLTGEAFCECKDDYIYIPQDGNCIPEYEQGYCIWGEYIVRNEEDKPVCVPNPCGVDGSVYHNDTGKCYPKKYIGFCKEEYIWIIGEEAECGELDLKNIFEVPTLRRCPRGSARDYLHECRKRHRMPSMSSVLNTPHLYGGCSRGWTKGRDGRCKKIVNLFG